MIKSLLAGILISFMLLSLGCAEEEKATPPNFSQLNWEQLYDTILRVRAVGESGIVELLTRTNPGPVYLDINNVASEGQNTIFDDNILMYKTTLGNAALTPGASLAYDLTFSGGHSSGFFRVPWQMDPVFPMFGDGNYRFEWSISAPPQLYLVDFTWVLQSVPGRIKEQISGASLSHTILKELWGGDVIYPDKLSLHAINISRSDKALLVYAETVSEQWF